MSVAPGARNTKNHSTSRTRERPQRPRGHQRPSQAGGWRIWPWLLVGVVLAAASVFAFAGRGATGGSEPSAVTGALVPEHTVHDFGQVRMDGGLIDARFPLTVQNPVRVTSLETT